VSLSLKDDKSRKILNSRAWIIPEENGRDMSYYTASFHYEERVEFDIYYILEIISTEY
jgi:hypothetical protein